MFTFSSLSSLKLLVEVPQQTGRRRRYSVCSWATVFELSWCVLSWGLNFTCIAERAACLCAVDFRHERIHTKRGSHMKMQTEPEDVDDLATLEVLDEVRESDDRYNHIWCIDNVYYGPVLQSSGPSQYFRTQKVLIKPEELQWGRHYDAIAVLAAESQTERLSPGKSELVSH